MNFYEAQAFDEIANQMGNKRDKQYQTAQSKALPDNVLVATTANLPKPKKAPTETDLLTDKEYKERQAQKKDYFDKEQEKIKARDQKQKEGVKQIKADASAKRIWYNPTTWNPTAGLWTQLKNSATNALEDAARPNTFELK